MIWLGEVHDNPAHHRVQAELVAQVAPAALVFEMLTPAQAAAPQPSDRRDAEALDAALGWSGGPWPDWAMYAPVFLAAPDAALYGAARSQDDMRRAVENGAGTVFGDDAERFGLTDPLPPDEQSVREALQAAAHCDALPADLLPGMVGAQRLRDADLAAAALTALDETGGPVVVIAGSGHARTDWGGPALLARAAPDVAQFAVGQVEGEAAREAPYDAVMTAAAPGRGDPCAAFR